MSSSKKLLLLCELKFVEQVESGLTQLEILLKYIKYFRKRSYFLKDFNYREPTCP